MSKRLNFNELILFEDENFVLINKPFDISTLEDRKSDVNILNNARKYSKNAIVCHRLDKETSGVLAIAKHEDAYRHLNSQFAKRKVNKIYHAVVESIERFEHVMFSAPIKVLKKGVVKLDKIEGKEAHTIINSIKTFHKHTLVECNPITGRMHQIRIHLSSLRAPIVGDTQYGGHPFYLSTYKKRYNVKKYEEELPIMNRVALHARSLKFVDMDNNTRIVEAPYPKDFAVMLKQMEKYTRY